MDTHADDNIAAIATLGAEMRQILDSESFQTGLTMVRARIFTEWAESQHESMREKLHAELRGLERLMEAFRDIDDEGVVARETIKRWHAEDTGEEADTPL